MRAQYPILEFDPAVEAMIEARSYINPIDAPEACVLCFFGDLVARIVETTGAKLIAGRRWEDGPKRLYEISHRGQRLAFIHCGVGAPKASGILEMVLAFGCRKFMACGGCGVLDSTIAVGRVIVPTSAVRDEGTSYHYLPPGREVPVAAKLVAHITGVLESQGVPYHTGKTWTTDAPYRETAGKVALRRDEGCIAVEMEAAALLAVAQFRDVPLGQLLYGGDDLGGETWDHRNWQTVHDVRERLFWLAADCVVGL